MTFKTRSLSILVLGLGLAGASFAQDTKTTTPDTAATPTTKAERHAGKHGDMAGRKGGRGEFAGRKGGRREFGKFGGRAGRFGGFGAGVTLTEDQKAQIQKIREANRPDPA